MNNPHRYNNPNNCLDCGKDELSHFFKCKHCGGISNWDNHPCVEQNKPKGVEKKFDRGEEK